LCHDALVINPQDITAKIAIYELANKFPAPNVVFAGIKFGFFALKILIHRVKEGCDRVINPAENLQDAKPSSEFAFRSILHAAYGTGCYKLASSGREVHAQPV
jgi:hypothetical protein